MKKLMMILAVAAMTVQSASAQKALENSKTFDNWYIGILGGANSKTTHNSDFFSNVNPHAGLRVGRYYTPVVGWVVEGDVFFRDKAFGLSDQDYVKALNVDLLGTVNLSNWFGGYLGQPRVFEVVALGGLGWNHIFKSKSSVKNDLISKLGFDLTFNLGEAKAWQIYLEPAINFNLTSDSRVKYNVNNSALQLSLGINYKFGTSNGTHNFKEAQLRDQGEIDDLNARINELRGENDKKDMRIARDIRRIAELEDSLAAAKNVKPTVVKNVVTKVVNNNVLQPTVIFGQGKSAVDAAQMASVAMIAQYMKNHPESRILIKGYASPEGNPELNQRLSEARAASVKNALVSRYGIPASRLETQGMGATDELFDEVDFNRVATFTDLSK
ncbi:MAG: OmpA family protein [Prevotella sp.]|nr:OmpA family protein [Prevotella sp.]